MRQPRFAVQGVAAWRRPETPDEMTIMSAKKIGFLRLALVAALLLGAGLVRTFAGSAGSSPGLAASANAAIRPGTAEPQNGSGQPAAREPEEHGLPQSAVEIARPWGFPITNSMIVTWVVALALIVFARLAMRKMQEVPAGAQNFWEWLVESLHDFLEGIIGPDLVRKTFWFFATIFIFILFCNWCGLVPGVGTIGFEVQHADGHTEWKPLLRGANADLNMTFAMAMIFFLLWTIWALQANGFKGFILELFGPKGDLTGPLKFLVGIVFVAVGLLEVVSILFRPVSLSFRLYGNIFAGENMLEAMGKLVPSLGWLLPIPFYFLELLVGLVQALVFMLLTAVFTMLICQHEEGAKEGHH